ncbi:LIM/homeobox protein Lhx5-like [Rattus norvegicus]|uniref:LIM/homeobox protein Lhx5-like n=1 Tax=Rattus norvegicus TaxID=10116 RepID=UPI002FD7BEA3
MPSDSRRPHTRLTLQQCRILVRAFESNPLPGFATREQLGQRKGLSEDTIHIWFQNRRSRQALAPYQDVPVSQVQDVLLLDELLEEDQVEGDRPFPVDLDGNSGSKEYEGIQETILRCGHGELELQRPATPTKSPSNPKWHITYSDSSIRGRTSELLLDSQLPQWAQPEGQGQEQALTQGCNTGPLELFLDQLLMEVRVETLSPGLVHLEGGGQQMDTTPELPLSQEEYEALLDIL